MLDKSLAIISLLCLIAFLGVLVFFVKETDLTVIAVVVVIMAAYDFYAQLFRKKRTAGDGQ